MLIRAWVLGLCFLPLLGFALESRYTSGLVRHYASEPQARLSAKRFLKKEFEDRSPGFEWRLVHEASDAQHRHQTWQLYYQNVRVAHRQLKLHIRREGWVEYASSNWDLLFSIEPPKTKQAAVVREKLIAAFRSRYATAPGRLSVEPVLWISKDSEKATPAFEATLTSHRLGIYRKFFVNADLTLLEEERTFRLANVYTVSPLGGAPLDPVALPGLGGAATTLSNDRFHVWRDQLIGAATTQLSEVDPSTDFHLDGDFSDDPANYDPVCQGTPAQCPNQGFDSVNVYYHLENYRQRLNTYLTTLGAEVSFSSDPLQVYVNSLSIDIDGDGDGTNDANNAAYIFVPCRDDDPTVESCLIFLRPAQIDSTTCGDDTVFYSVAREALIVVHEYQHYVTDQITHLVAGRNQANVGDALHEAYSDYFAASHISELSGQTVTAVGAYAFQNCASIIRDLATLKVYDSNNTNPGPHVYGWSFASGLWQLRTELGREGADLLALKSLFLMPVEPGFVDAVEALVQADLALNGGSTVRRIRELFYGEIQFIGGQTGQFRDIGAGVIEMGLRGCSSVHRPSRGVPGLSLLLLLIALVLGRVCTRRWA